MLSGMVAELMLSSCNRRSDASCLPQPSPAPLPACPAACWQADPSPAPPPPWPAGEVRPVGDSSPSPAPPPWPRSSSSRRPPPPCSVTWPCWLTSPCAPAPADLSPASQLPPNNGRRIIASLPQARKRPVTSYVSRVLNGPIFTLQYGGNSIYILFFCLG